VLKSTLKLNILIAAILAGILHAGAWFLINQPVTPPPITQALASVSYTPASPDEIATSLNDEARQKIRKDIETIASVSSSVRLYASDEWNAEVLDTAAKFDMSVTAGAWLTSSPTANNIEISRTQQLLSRNPNIRSVIIGNETLLRKELKPDELIHYLRIARRAIRQPVSTGETWDIWLKHPELVREVDFIAAHILPYWEGIEADKAVEYAIDRYNALRAAYPGKKVLIAEFGWPSRGYNRKAADTGPLIQGDILRKFVNEASNRDIPFNLIEAYDQPWKVNEGSVGAYWGLFDTDRNLKFPMRGMIEEEMFYPRMGLAVAIGTIITILGLCWFYPTFLHALGFSIAANTLSAGVAMAALYPVENYLNPGSAFAWGIGFLLMFPLTAMTLVKIHEVAEVTLGHRPTRLIRPPIPGAQNYPLPKVSIHIPAYREQPDMLKKTLDSVAALDYPNFEVLVVINNTPDEAFWRPIEDHCRKLGPHFKFINLLQVSGFKAGALNMAMAEMADDAEIIALLDADYIVSPDWLKDLVPVFANPKVALVQAPQDHRDGDESALKAVMDAEYAGFFDIGMVQRNEQNAAIAHGTMLLIRRSAFDEVDRWNTDTITEDTELGLRLYETGYETQYTNKRYGWGLLPDTFLAFKTQRHRWAVGAMQIIRKHWRHMRPSSTTLTRHQKMQFVIGWSYWLSDAFGVAAAYLNLLWVPMIIFVGVMIPMLPFTLPILVAFAVNLLHCVMLYGVRVRIPFMRIAGAALAAMSLQMTVAKAIYEGFTDRKIGFKRTEKGGLAHRGKKFSARAELLTGLVLVLGGSALISYNESEAMEIYVFASTLFVQSLPFLAAALVASMERSSE
jgi:cellulose synthase/poly-beta-1,6-N-acetylglucosamine synthase-like glycosyltransferase/exo-beta-1,3-glucanase (GH17 family)